ncbi:hypothetical protein BCR44DRAFT_35349, partial [Catenaria anguillulae PL171]
LIDSVVATLLKQYRLDQDTGTRTHTRPDGMTRMNQQWRQQAAQAEQATRYNRQPKAIRNPQTNTVDSNATQKSRSDPKANAKREARKATSGCLKCGQIHGKAYGLMRGTCKVHVADKGWRGGYIATPFARRVAPACIAIGLTGRLTIRFRE